MNLPAGINGVIDTDRVQIAERQVTDEIMAESERLGVLVCLDPPVRETATISSDRITNAPILLIVAGQSGENQLTRAGRVEQARQAQQIRPGALHHSTKCLRRS